MLVKFVDKWIESESVKNLHVGTNSYGYVVHADLGGEDVYTISKAFDTKEEAFEECEKIVGKLNSLKDVVSEVVKTLDDGINYYVMKMKSHESNTEEFIRFKSKADAYAEVIDIIKTSNFKERR